MHHHHYSSVEDPQRRVDGRGPLLSATVYYANTGAEFRLPALSNALAPDIWLYVAVYFFGFQLLAVFVKHRMWRNAIGSRRYRLQNLSVCFVHSFVSGFWSLAFTLANSDLMLNHTLHWYNHSARHLILFSTGYFIHDAVDMLRNEWSRWTLELLFHHAACVFVFFCALLPQKFLLYAYWALLMEVNSLFLHMRTISQLSGIPKSNLAFFRLVQLANLGTLIVFRFGIQAFQISWVWTHRQAFHYFYYYVGFYGGLFFLALNTCLLVRVLAADKFLPAAFERGGLLSSLCPTNRDDQASRPQHQQQLAIDDQMQASDKEKHV